MKINFAVIGTNKIVHKFVDAAGRTENFRLKGVYSRSKEKAEEYAKKWGADLSFDSLDELAECEEIDAVYVASPNYCHAAQTIQMLNSGKHVLCEKPIASNSAEFELMKEAALKNERVLLEAMRNIYCPGFECIKENLHKLGKIRKASFLYCQYSSRYDNFKKGIIENAFKPELSNGALMDIGVYCVHPMAVLFGKPEAVLSSSLKLANGVDGAGFVLLEYDGMQGMVNYSKITDSRVPSEIQGEDGIMVIEKINEPQNVSIYYRNGETEIFEIPQTDNDMVYEIEKFMKMITEKQFANPYLQDSEIKMQIMDEIRKQQKICFPADGK